MKQLDKLITANESCLVLRNENDSHGCIWVVSHSTWVLWNRACNRKGDCFQIESSPCCRCTALWSLQSVEDLTSPCGCALPYQGLGMTALWKHTIKIQNGLLPFSLFICSSSVSDFSRSGSRWIRSLCREQWAQDRNTH